MNKKLKMHTIRSRLIRSNAIIISILVFFIGVVVYYSASSLHLRDSKQLNSQLVITMGKSFDEMDKSFNRVINNITISEELIDALTNPSNDEDTSNALLKKMINVKSIFVDELDAWYIYNKDGDLCTYQHRKYIKGEQYTLFPAIDEQWFSESGEITSRVVDGKLIFTRKIISFKTLETVGYFLAIYDQDILEQKLITTNPSKNRFIAVFDEYGSIMAHNYPSEKTMEYFLQNVDLTGIGENEIAFIPEIGDTVISQYNSKSTNWQVVSVVAVSEINYASQVLLNIVILIGVLGLILGFITQSIVSIKIVKPLSELIQVIDKVKKNNYKQRMQPQKSVELNLLAESFNELIETTDTLINQVLKHEIKYRDIQLDALQSQIHPHLLYNTLECINWLAEFGRKEDIRRITVAFSNNMKSLFSGEKIISLEKEINFTKDFLLIYEIFLENKLSYNINLSQDIDLDLKIPRLTIQPLVENAVIHGIKNNINSSGGHIAVNITSNDKGIIISVLDDGVGIGEEIVSAINKYSYMPDEDKNPGIGVGIRNVIDRLFLVYDGKARLTISSSINWGTTVDIFIPVKDGDNE